MNDQPRNEARPWGRPGSENLNIGGDRFTVDSTDRSDIPDARSIASKRRIARQLGEAIDRLDGPTKPVLPDVGERCPRWCSAMTHEQMHYWFEKVGSCPCPQARQAVAS